MATALLLTAKAPAEKEHACFLSTRLQEAPGSSPGQSTAKTRTLGFVCGELFEKFSNSPKTYWSSRQSRSVHPSEQSERRFSSAKREENRCEQCERGSVRSSPGQSTAETYILTFFPSRAIHRFILG